MSATGVDDNAVVLESRDLAKHYPVSQGMFKPKALARALDGV